MGNAMADVTIQPTTEERGQGTAQGSNQQTPRDRRQAARGRNQAQAKDRIKFCQHSALIFWWPVWFSGYILGLLSTIFGDKAFELIKHHTANWLTLLNLLYVGLILFVVYFTNVKTSSMHMLVYVLTTVSLVLITWLILRETDAFKYVPSMPNFLVFMNANFYFTFSTGLLLIWMLVVFIIDPRNAWYVEYGTVVHRESGIMHSAAMMEGFDVSFRRNDFPCQSVLGMRLIGDVTLTNAAKTHNIPNVAFVHRKVNDAKGMIVS
jgi:hypothetical protein